MSVIILLSMFLVSVLNINAQVTDSAHELYDIGKKFSDEGLYDKALPYFKAAVEEDPDYKQAFFELAKTSITCRDFTQGFTLMHEYFINEDPLDKQWHGESLEGKRLLIKVPHLPLDDIMLFIRFLDYLKDECASIILAINCYSASFFAINPMLFVVISDDGSSYYYNYDADCYYDNGSYDCYYTYNNTYYDNDCCYYNDGTNCYYDGTFSSLGYDYQVHLLSLPFLCNKQAMMMHQCPYFYSEKSYKEYWQEKMTYNSNTAIGLYFNPDNTVITHEDCISLINKVCALGNTNVYYLQSAPYYMQPLLPGIHNNVVMDFLPTDGTSLKNFAAIIDNLDLVITDNDSIAELAGGLGKEVFVVAPYNADWRYYQQNSNSLWYSNMTLFKPQYYENWQLFFDAIIDQTEKFCSSGEC